MPAPGDATTIPWNFVTQNLVVDERLRKKLREKITQLQRYLKHFPPDAVHLNVALERHARRNLHTARLTLRLPSNILHSAKSAPDVITAFDLAVKALLRELEKLKAGLRHEADWKPKERREKLRREIKSGTFAPLPQPAGQGPQDPAGVVADFLRGHYRSLVRHARRQVQGRVLAGEIRPGAIDPRGIADDVVRLTLSGWKQKPPRVSWRVWFYQLIRREVLRRARLLRRAPARSLDEVRRAREEAQTVEGYDPEQPLDGLEPFVAELRESVAGPVLAAADKAAEQMELVEIIHARTHDWPRREREIFELHFIEGFEPDDVAMVVGEPPGDVRETITRLHQRLRALLLEDASR